MTLNNDDSAGMTRCSPIDGCGQPKSRQYSASTRVFTPPISTSGRKLAARADVDVGATSQVDSGS